MIIFLKTIITLCWLSCVTESFWRQKKYPSKHKDIRLVRHIINFCYLISFIATFILIWIN